MPLLCITSVHSVASPPKFVILVAVLPKKQNNHRYSRDNLPHSSLDTTFQSAPKLSDRLTPPSTFPLDHTLFDWKITHLIFSAQLLFQFIHIHHPSMPYSCLFVLPLKPINESHSLKENPLKICKYKYSLISSNQWHDAPWTRWLEYTMFIQSEESIEQLNGTSPSSLPDISSAKGWVGWAAEAFTLCTFIHNWFLLARFFRTAYPLQLLWLLLGHGSSRPALLGAYNLILPCYCTGLLCTTTAKDEIVDAWKPKE